MKGNQIAAIVWAQWRSMLNHTVRKRSGGSLVLGAVLTSIWYAIWTAAALGVCLAVAEPENLPAVEKLLPAGLLGILVYWQLVPILMASSGVSLDMARIIIYPVPRGQLFLIETVLRITTALEMVIVTAGLGAGLLLNPVLPWWTATILIPFAATNVLISAGLRDLFSRMMARRRIRDLIIFFVVLCAAAPQALLVSNIRPKWREFMADGFGSAWPWSAAATIASGHLEASPVALVFIWLAAAWWFARAQFGRSLKFDEAAARASSAGSRPWSLPGAIASLADRLLPDPVAAIVGKEIRFLSRAPRFRLLFLMGFSFGLLVWLPMALRSGASPMMRANYLTVISAYALMLLGEALCWNIFGMDRGAAQTWFVAPVAFSTVLIAKNIAAAIFIFLELSIVSLLCLLLRLPVAPHQFAEAFASTGVLACLMLSLGNIISVRYPRAVDPAQSWRNSGGRAQALLLLLYPLVGFPVFLAYGARFAFDSSLAFWAVIALDLILAGVVYTVALDSAVAAAWSRRELIVGALSHSETPIAG